MSDRNDARDRVTRAFEQIDRYDAEVGAFVDVLHEQTESELSRLEAAERDGHPRGPLHGVPVGVKELFDVEGADGSYGSEVLAGRRAHTDAALVTALRHAGAVVVGTTRSHEFGWGITTQHSTRGSTRNPWDLERVPGGSSGGSAAAVSMDMVPLAVGSDTGGSIRLPAAFCGVFGLKTTFGRISRAGGVALAPSFDTPGFLARSVELLAAAFAASAGADPLDAATLLGPATTAEPAPSQFADLRFATPNALMPDGIEPERSAALAAMCEALSSVGLRGADVELPSAQGMLETFVPLQMAEASDVHRVGLETFPKYADRYGADVRSRLETAANVTLADYLAARRRQDEIKAAFALAFQHADVIVSAVGPTAPSRASTPDVVTVGGVDVPFRTAMMTSTVPQNLAGLPSITCPLGLDAIGMPIGIQLTGPPWSEPMLLAVTRAIEADGVVAVGRPPLLFHHSSPGESLP